MRTAAAVATLMLAGALFACALRSAPPRDLVHIEPTTTTTTERTR